MAEARGPSWAGAVGAVAVRPWLWSTALRAVARSAPRGWWRRAPFLPRPPGAFVAFRLETQYGTVPGRDRPAPSADDLVAYLGWCRALHRARRDRARRAGSAPGRR